MFVWVVSKGEKNGGGSVEAVYTTLDEAKKYTKCTNWMVVEANRYWAWVDRVDYYLIERMEVKGKAS